MNKKKQIILDVVLWVLLTAVTALIIVAYPDSDIERGWMYVWAFWGMFKSSQMFSNYICKQEVQVEEFVDGEEEG